jgi:transposase
VEALKTLPCVGKVLSMVMMLEIGKVDRFPTAAHLASYAGLVLRVLPKKKSQIRRARIWPQGDMEIDS